VTTDFDAATALQSSQCRVQSTGAVSGGVATQNFSINRIQSHEKFYAQQK